MKFTNLLGYPEAFVNQITKGSYKPKKESIGVTALIDAPLIRHLQIKEWDNLVSDVDDYFKMARGIAWHNFLEAGLPNDCEGEHLERINYDKNLTIGFKMDLWDEANGIISDYKTCSPWAIVFGEEKKWEQQLNIYAWAKRKQGFKVNKLVVYVFLWDWSAYEAERDKTYPQRQFYVKELPLWSFEQQQQFVDARVEYHKNPKECTSEEKWQQNKINVNGQTIIVNGPVYAIRKKNVKKAVRVMPTHTKCMEYISEKKMVSSYKSGAVYIEERKGNCRRCKEFCPVRSVCSYAKS